MTHAHTQPAGTQHRDPRALELAQHLRGQHHPPRTFVDLEDTYLYLLALWHCEAHNAGWCGHVHDWMPWRQRVRERIMLAVFWLVPSRWLPASMKHLVTGEDADR